MNKLPTGWKIGIPKTENDSLFKVYTTPDKKPMKEIIAFAQVIDSLIAA